MATNENNEQIDSDILQCKADIFGVRDIIPPFSAKNLQTPKAHNPTGMPEPNEKPKEPKAGSQSEVPQFNLADDIMAQQRQISANARKGPAQKEQAPKTESPKPIEYPNGPKMTTDSDQDWIIAQIVARDIERLSALES